MMIDTPDHLSQHSESKMLRQSLSIQKHDPGHALG